MDVVLLLGMQFEWEERLIKLLHPARCGRLGHDYEIASLRIFSVFSPEVRL